MTKYATGNPVLPNGSADPRDLFDNAQNLDVLVNSQEKTEHPDRLGVPRKTLHGMEQDFQQFLVSSGYTGTGAGGAYEDYDADGPLTITALNQIFTKDGEFYRLKPDQAMPYSTTDWVTDEVNMVAVGDAALRQELGGGVRHVRSLSGLQGIVSRFDADTAFMIDGKRSGAFNWVSGDHSSDVSRDEVDAGQGNGGVWVAPSSDLSGATGAWRRVFNESLGVTPDWYGALNGERTTDTLPMQKAHDTGLTVNYTSGEVYLYDPTELPSRGIVATEGQTVIGYGSTVKLFGKSYSQNIYFLGVSFAVLFSEDSNRYAGLKVYGLTFDGNSENVSLDPSYSSNALWLYKQDDPVVNGFSTIDMPVGNGGLPAIIARFCDNAIFEKPVTSKRGGTTYCTDRQSLSVIESTGKLINANFGNSKEREPVLVSSETPVAWKKSDFHVEGGRYDNTGTLNGSRIIRFSGASDGSIYGGAQLQSEKQNTGPSADIEGIFIAYPEADGMPLGEREHNILISNVTVEGCHRDVKIQNNGLTKVVIDGLTSVNVDSALYSSDSYSNGAEVGYLKVSNYSASISYEPPIIENCENLSMKAVTVMGGITHAEIKNYGSLSLESVFLSENTDSSYVLNVESQLAAYADTFENQPIITGCGGFNNAANNARFAGVSTPSGDAVAWLCANNTFAGFRSGGVGSVPCQRSGFYWIWADSAGSLRIKGGAPKSDADGSVVGSQS